MTSAKPWHAHYEDDVPSHLEYPERPHTDLFAASVETYADRAALRLVLRYLPLGLGIHTTMTYAELDEASSRLAVALQALGVEPGDRVAVMLPNLSQQVMVFYAVLKLGAVVVNVNPTYTAQELAYLLADSQAETVVMLSGFYERLAQVRDETRVRRMIHTELSDTLSFPLNLLVQKQARDAGLRADVSDESGIHRLFKLIESHPAETSVADVQPDDVALLQYTSGTTGAPKGVVLTHRNLVASVTQIRAWLTSLVPGEERILIALPLFHIYGCLALLVGVGIGATTILLPDPRQTKLLLQTLQAEKVTVFPGVPALFRNILNHDPDQAYDLRSLKACFSGAAPLPMALQKAFGQRIDGRLVEAYGQTEAVTATANPMRGQRKAGSIGVPLPDTEAKIVPLNTAAEAGTSETDEPVEGELYLRGPQVMRAYWNRPEKTAETLNEAGWLHTGDVGRMDEEGYVYLSGRKDDLIIASGYNISPQEVETVLEAHEHVAEAAAVGVPDPKRGETVKAVLVLKEGEDLDEEEIVAHCQAHLAPYKVPKLVAFRQELPRNQVGEILRRKLVEEHEQA